MPDKEAFSTESFYARPVIPLLISLMLGITSGLFLPDCPVLFGIATAICLCLILWNIFQKKPACIAPLGLFYGLGYLSIVPFLFPQFSANHIIHYTDQKKFLITGKIDSWPVEKQGRIKFELEVTALDDADRTIPVTGKIQTTVIPENLCPPSPLCIGDTIMFTSRIKSIRNFHNPGGFNYERYMAFQGVWGTAYAKESALFIAKRDDRKGIRSALNLFRANIMSLIDSTGSGDPQDVLRALITGDRSRITPRLEEAFNRTGVSHLLAISGLHIGIVASVFFICFTWLLSFITPLLWHAWTKKTAALLSLIPVITYGGVAGMSPSTQRAVIMVAMYMMTFWVEREQDIFNTLALAALLILILHPPALFSISFQLSFSSVFAIIYGMSKLSGRAISHEKPADRPFYARIGDKLLASVMVSVFATIGTLPIVLYYFNQISLIGVFTNLIFIPLIGFIVVSLGIASVFFSLISDPAAQGLLYVSAQILKISLDGLYFFSKLPFAAITTVTPSILEICCFYMFIWALLNFKGTASFQKRKVIAIAIGVAVIFLGDVGFWVYQRFWQDDLKITVLDVGDGNSALLEIPRGPCILVDGGGFSDNRLFDVGEKIIAPYLWRKKIKTVDTIILSHPDSDHLNGLLYIAEQFNVKHAWTNNEAEDTWSYQRFVEILKEKKIQECVFKEMPRSHRINTVALDVLYPPEDFLIQKAHDRWRNVNNNSLVLKVKFGSYSFLFPGDIRARGEKDLIALSGENLESTVLVAPHHGSVSSSSSEFLDAVQPEIVIVSVGWNSRFKFPHPSVLTRYRDHGCKIFRTDHQGAITLNTDGKTIQITPTVLSP